MDMQCRQVQEHIKMACEQVVIWLLFTELNLLTILPDRIFISIMWIHGMEQAIIVYSPPFVMEHIMHTYMIKRYIIFNKKRSCKP